MSVDGELEDGFNSAARRLLRARSQPSAALEHASALHGDGITPHNSDARRDVPAARVRLANQPTHAGWLQRRAGKLVKRWTKRWAILQGNRRRLLWYGPQRNSDKRKGGVGKCRYVDIHTAAAFHKGGMRWAFRLHDAMGNAYLFRALDDDGYLEWAHAFAAAGFRQLIPTPPPSVVVSEDGDGGATAATAADRMQFATAVGAALAASRVRGSASSGGAKPRSSAVALPTELRALLSSPKAAVARGMLLLHAALRASGAGRAGSDAGSDGGDGSDYDSDHGASDDDGARDTGGGGASGGRGSTVDAEEYRRRVDIVQAYGAALKCLVFVLDCVDEASQVDGAGSVAATTLPEAVGVGDLPGEAAQRLKTDYLRKDGYRSLHGELPRHALFFGQLGGALTHAVKLVSHILPTLPDMVVGDSGSESGDDAASPRSRPARTWGQAASQLGAVWTTVPSSDVIPKPASPKPRSGSVDSGASAGAGAGAGGGAARRASFDAHIAPPHHLGGSADGNGGSGVDDDSGDDDIDDDDDDGASHYAGLDVLDMSGSIGSRAFMSDSDSVASSRFVPSVASDRREDRLVGGANDRAVTSMLNMSASGGSAPRTRARWFRRGSLSSVSSAPSDHSDDSVRSGHNGGHGSSSDREAGGTTVPAVDAALTGGVATAVEPLVPRAVAVEPTPTVPASLPPAHPPVHTVRAASDGASSTAGDAATAATAATGSGGTGSDDSDGVHNVVVMRSPPSAAPAAASAVSTKTPPRESTQHQQSPAHVERASAPAVAQTATQPPLATQGRPAVAAAPRLAAAPTFVVEEGDSTTSDEDERLAALRGRIPNSAVQLVARHRMRSGLPPVKEDLDTGAGTGSGAGAGAGAGANPHATSAPRDGNAPHPGASPPRFRRHGGPSGRVAGQWREVPVSVVAGTADSLHGEVWFRHVATSEPGFGAQLDLADSQSGPHPAATWVTAAATLLPGLLVVALHDDGAAQDAAAGAGAGVSTVSLALHRADVTMCEVQLLGTSCGAIRVAAVQWWVDGVMACGCRDFTFACRSPAQLGQWYQGIRAVATTVTQGLPTGRTAAVHTPHAAQDAPSTPTHMRRRTGGAKQTRPGTAAPASGDSTLAVAPRPSVAGAFSLAMGVAKRRTVVVAGAGAGAGAGADAACPLATALDAVANLSFLLRRLPLAAFLVCAAAQLAAVAGLPPALVAVVAVAATAACIALVAVAGAAAHEATLGLEHAATQAAAPAHACAVCGVHHTGHKEAGSGAGHCHCRRPHASFQRIVQVPNGVASVPSAALGSTIAFRVLPTLVLSVGMGVSLPPLCVAGAQLGLAAAQGAAALDVMWQSAGSIAGAALGGVATWAAHSLLRSHREALPPLSADSVDSTVSRGVIRAAIAALCAGEAQGCDDDSEVDAALASDAPSLAVRATRASLPMDTSKAVWLNVLVQQWWGDLAPLVARSIQRCVESCVAELPPPPFASRVAVQNVVVGTQPPVIAALRVADAEQRILHATVVWQCHADAGVTLCVDAHRVPGVPASPWRARLHDLSIAADIQVHAADVLRLLRQGGGASSPHGTVVPFSLAPGRRPHVQFSLSPAAGHGGLDGTLAPANVQQSLGALPEALLSSWLRRAFAGL